MTDAAIDSRPSTSRPKRHDHSMFEAELSGNVLNLHLLGRIMHWLKPYRLGLFVSAFFVLAASVLAVLMEIVISLVLVDYIIIGESDGNMPDLGMIELTQWIENSLGIPALFSAGIVFFVAMTVHGIFGHAHRQTLVGAIVKALRDLRQDLFAHLETRPSSFYDGVPIGRIMTRVTNDIEALFEMLRGIGSLVGEFVPFFVALSIMLSASVELTLILLALVPIVAVATYFFRQATREVFRLVRNSVSSLNQNLQENLSGMQVVQLSERQSLNLKNYTRINKSNRRYEFRSINLSTFYGAFNDSLASIGLGIIIW
ncbi:MAG: ABC transporter ATP-binding protein, partial [Gammaproteobacteria bacterium]|nr:ABC transporter ATP-binding protein [Gammaproteobacteria bacterium]